LRRVSQATGDCGGGGGDCGGGEVVRILHPSPASPAANRGWSAAATEQLIAAGVWK
jgi:single-strand selective monofunctional uracil DNA glycosylase